MFEKIQIELNRFDWSGVSGVSDIIMVFLSILLLIGLRQGAKSIKESSLSRDADILRWAMSEMDELKPKIRIITDAHKNKRFNLPALAENTKSIYSHIKYKLLPREQLNVKRKIF